MKDQTQLEIAVSNCDREAIHIPGVIQPFGALIATDQLLEEITHVSANLPDFLPIKSPNLLNQSCADLLSDTFLHDLKNAASLHNLQTQRHRLGIYDVGQQAFEVSLHQSAQSLILELESLPEETAQMSGVVSRVQSMLGYLRGNMDSEKMLNQTVSVLRHVTYFDRVMAYRFLPDGSGEVVAESRSCQIEPFLGLRYPASDIPQNVRDIALKMPVRAIADLQAEPVLILSNQVQPPLDLSLTYLRGVSPIHVEYLTNMGVRASMNLAIVIQNRLWGLLACHHYSPKLLSLDLRSSCELFSQMLSLNLQQVLAKERLQNRKQIGSITRHFFETPKDNFQFIDSADLLRDALCPVMNSDGLAVMNQQVIKTSGETPNEPFIRELVQQCQADPGEELLPIEQLRQIPMPAKDAEQGESAGALVMKLSEIEQLYLIFFRNEISTKIRWGGNPEKDIVYGRFGPRLRPRASFDEYIETVQGRCVPWSNRDIDAALELRASLLYLAASKLDVIQQEAVQQQRQQDLLIAELNHRVKNILALIRSITRQTKESATDVEAYAATLEKRIAALASAHDLVAGHGLEWPLLRELIQIELRPYLAESTRQIQLSGPEVGLKANFVPTFVLVLHELVSNAAKYGALSVPNGQVKVRWLQKNGGLTVIWKERNGPLVAPPTRQGFGRKLIERSITYEFEGQAELLFAPSGVEAKFWIPNELILWQSRDINAFEEPEVHSEEPQSSLHDQVLVVEDNMLIAMELEEMLQSLGFKNIDCVPRVSAALKLLKSQSYTLGLLDIDLKSETSFAIADELLRRNIPFIFTTGYDSKYTVPEHLEGITRLKKPLNPTLLNQTLAALVEKTQ